ncbi:MAG: divalent metal cation transporter [Candidatus Competibacteraceae bacterium]
MANYIWMGNSPLEQSYPMLKAITGVVVDQTLVEYDLIIFWSSALWRPAQSGLIPPNAKAAQALRLLAGNAATFLFAIGIIGAGVLAVPVLTGSSAYAVAETFGWHVGLNANPRQAKAFYLVIAMSTLIGSGINFLGINPITPLFWTAVINGLLAPPLLVILLVITSNLRLMGTQVNGRLTQSLGWLTALLMLAAAVGMLITGL